MIGRLSHTDLGVDDLGAARHFYVDTLGFLVASESEDALHLRGSEEFDLWSLKLTRGVAGLRSFTFRVDSEGSLDALAVKHREHGIDVLELARGHELGLGRAIEVRTPDGFAVRFVHEVAEVDLLVDGSLRHPMRHTHECGGIPPNRLHHLNVRHPDVNVSLEYWTGFLGFSVSEMALDDAGSPWLAWIRCSHSTHDLALGPAPETSLHHIAFSVADAAAVMRTCDVIADGGYADAIEFGPGRHGATNAMLVYALDPAGNRLEFFTGDYVRDHDRPPIVWDHETYVQSGRLWWGPKPPKSFLENMTPVVQAVTP